MAPQCRVDHLGQIVGSVVDCSRLDDRARRRGRHHRSPQTKIAVALRDEYGRVPTADEINEVFHPTRVMHKAVLGLHYRRQEQKKSGQLAIF
jgi:hypothetical protein